MGWTVLMAIFLSVGNLVQARTNSMDSSIKATKMLTDAAALKPKTTEQRVVAPGTFQGDIILTKQQTDDLKASAQNLHDDGVFKRSVVRVDAWKDATIPYQFASGISSTSKAEMLAAMGELSDLTCLKFPLYSKQTAEELGHENYILIRPQLHNAGCSSQIGFVNPGPQMMFLEEDCFNKWTLVHELTHAMGRYHEHARSDRDDYVIIDYDAIEPNYEDQFLPHEMATYGLPYDFHSIMHYSPTVFSKDHRMTIRPINPINQFYMGQRESYSFYDQEWANIMYSCAEHCVDPPTCVNEGFLNKDCKCVCKPGFNGITCSDEIQSDRNADCIYTPTALTGVIQNEPAYGLSYQNLLNCIWFVQGPEGSYLTLKITDIDLEMVQVNTCGDYVVVRAGHDMYNTDEVQYCGEEPPPEITSTTNQLMLIFSSDGDNYGFPKGFRAEYKIHVASTTAAPFAPTTQAVTTAAPTEPPQCDTYEGSCGGNFTASEGCIASPNYGIDSYPNSLNCIYYIQVAEGERVQLTVRDIHIEDQDECSWDQLAVELGDDVPGRLRMCGQDIPSGSFVSLSNSMVVSMISDSNVNGRGFAAEYRAIRLE